MIFRISVLSVPAVRRAVQIAWHLSPHDSSGDARTIAYQLSDKQLIFDYLYSADYPRCMAIAADRQ
jgi:hypothetical protein